MNLHQSIHSRLIAMLGNGAPSEDMLSESLRLLAKYRSTLIQNTLVSQYGTDVLSGPFAGMKFLPASAEGCHVPKLLGCYEEELHGFINTIPSRNYKNIINIGCAEGYYAIGLKRIAPRAEVFAFDINPEARRACAELASRNGVHLNIAEAFKPGDFQQFSPGKTLVWCDIEGHELQLLDPLSAPAMRTMDMVVELHPTRLGHAMDILPDRFRDSHHVELIEQQGHKPAYPPVLKKLGHLDQLLSQWEWRSVPTPWLILLSKQ